MLISCKNHINICYGMKSAFGEGMNYYGEVRLQATYMVNNIGITTIMWWQADSVAHSMFRWLIAHWMNIDSICKQFC